MTLDEAIEHAEEKAYDAEELGPSKCAREHRQLASWLKELRERRAREREMERLLNTGSPEDCLRDMKADDEAYEAYLEGLERL